VNTIVIIGASGYIGRNLVAELKAKGIYRIKVLLRADSKIEKTEGIEFFEGDIFAPQSLNGLLELGCIVVNLVYLWNDGEEKNLILISNLLDACRIANVKRLIHCSTAAVVGRVSDNLITENTLCRPISEYGITKLKVEHVIIEKARGNFDAVILRPTSVFGIEGEPLKKLAADIVGGSRWMNYLKSCLFGRRQMNLVHVANVVEAVIFLTQHTGRFEGDIFIVSNDDDKKNNFIDVERFLMDGLGVKKYCLPRLPLPLTLLKWLLMSMGRNNVNPHCNFDPSKLRKLGFKTPVSLSKGLAEYVAWYRASHHDEKGAKPL
jgi:nucleoside-diphosphate-sugar epimerase